MPPAAYNNPEIVWFSYRHLQPETVEALHHALIGTPIPYHRHTPAAKEDQPVISRGHPTEIDRDYDRHQKVWMDFTDIMITKEGGLPLHEFMHCLEWVNLGPHPLSDEMLSQLQWRLVRMTSSESHAYSSAGQLIVRLLLAVNSYLTHHRAQLVEFYRPPQPDDTPGVVNAIEGLSEEDEFLIDHCYMLTVKIPAPDEEDD